MSSKNAQITRARKRFATALRLEKDYLRSLNAVVKQIDTLTKMMYHGDMSDNEIKDANIKLDGMLKGYSKLLEPWATSAANKILTRIAAVDEAAWVQLGKTMSRELKKELQSAPTGTMLHTFLAEQVHLITSLPTEAAERVHEMTLNGITRGERASSIVEKILESGNVSYSRAKCIARTEVARTASGLTIARANYIGSTHYYWRTSGDSDVRIGHKEMDGKICEFAKPPAVNEGTAEHPRIMYHHAGCIWNCRCYIEPILDYEM